MEHWREGVVPAIRRGQLRFGFHLFDAEAEVKQVIPLTTRGRSERHA